MAPKLVIVCHRGKVEKVAKTLGALSQARGYEAPLVNLNTSSLADSEAAFVKASAAVVLVDAIEEVEKAKQALKLADNGANRIPLAVYAACEECGSAFSSFKLLFPVCEGGFEPHRFETFAKTLWGSLSLLGLPSQFPAILQVADITGHSESSEFVMPGTKGQGFKELTVLENRLLTAEGYERPSHLLRLDLEGSGLQYNLGDKLTLYPENDDATVEGALKVLGVPGERVISITAAEPCAESHALSNQVLSVRTLLKRILDLQGKATRKFIMSAALKATNPLEAAQLEALALGMEPKNAYVTESFGLFSYLRVLQMYPSVKMSLECLISVVPMIRSRSYSCASSPMKDPTKVESTFVVLKYPTKTGEFLGLSSNYLATRQPGQKIYATIRSEKHPVLVDTEVKYVGVALGSGVAPLRSIAEHFVCMKERDIHPQPMLLYYGVRHQAKDFIFSDEFAAHEKAGVLKLHPAFSHDQEEFITPATKILQDPKPIAEYLVDGNANCFFMYCGPSGPAYAAVEGAIIKAIETVHPSINGKAHIQKLRDAGRWQAYAYTPDPDPENPFSQQF